MALDTDMDTIMIMDTNTGSKNKKKQVKET